MLRYRGDKQFVMSLERSIKKCMLVGKNERKRFFFLDGSLVNPAQERQNESPLIHSFFVCKEERQLWDSWLVCR